MEEICENLGDGSSGCVQKVSNKEAVKIFEDNGPSTILEVAILKQLRDTNHCNYLTRYRFNEETKRMEAYMPLGELNLLDYVGQISSDPERVSIIRQIGKGIEELHNRDLIHLDIKLENIVRFNGQWKLVDFGLSFFGSCFLDSSHERFEAVTLNYRPPEIQYLGKISDKADIYSFGIVCLHILTKGSYLDVLHFRDYQFREQLDTIDQILSRDGKQLTREYGPSLVNLLHAMLDRTDHKRPSIELILNVLPSSSPRVPSIDCEAVTQHNLRIGAMSYRVPDATIRMFHANYKRDRRRHASFFYVLEALGRFSNLDIKLADRLAADVNDESNDLPRSPKKYIKFLMDIDFEILFHTPYSLLFSIVGSNDQATNLLYGLAIQYPLIYGQTDPRLIVSAITDWLGETSGATKIDVDMELLNSQKFL